MRAWGLILPLALASCTPSVRYASPVSQADARAIWLADHNRERAAFGSPQLVWDEGLAQAALAHARQLASRGRLQHSPRSARPGQGENLWMGTRSAYRPATMTGTWAAEKRQFRHGIFPHVSRSGDWRHVGHYTQMVWPTTTRLGCALASSPQWDVLVCRYSPPGNRDGTRI